jgi:hypothetical protein
MARLAAKEKVLFYPTPLEVIDLISSNIVAGQEGGTILDPCCGSGEPLARLGERLGLTTYGNELHPERFATAQPQLDRCLNGAREFLQVDGLFDVIFDNPPYDQSISGQRMEVDHIRHDLELLAPGGLGVWVIPETILDYELCALLAAQLSQINIRRFPLPAYDRFKQVVVFGLKRATTLGYTYTTANQLQTLVANGPPVLQAGEFAYQFRVSKEPITRFALDFPDAGQVLAEVEQDGLHRSDGWAAQFGATAAGFDDFQPVLRLSAGHTAFVIAAGIVDGTAVEIDGRAHIIKGSTSKRVTVTEETEQSEQGSQTKIREREKLVQTITALNLVDGSLTAYNSLDDKDGFAAFLLAHQALLVETIDRSYGPLFDPARNMAAWLSRLKRVRAPGLLPGQTQATGLLPAQQVRAVALAERLRTAKGVILVGEMGTGKTATSQAIAALIGEGNWKLVVVCPAQVVAKWKREAEKVLADFDVAVHLIGDKQRQPDGQGKVRRVAKPVLDVSRAMAEAGPSILVMSYQTAKNGPRWEHAPARQRKLLKHRVEVEEQIPTYPYRRMVEQVVTKIETVLCCPDCGEMLSDSHGPLTEPKELGNQQRWCGHCGAALWQQLPFKYGGRTAIADFLNRHYSGQYNLILDEAHHTKGADTDAGYASADLVAGARQVIAMTGTLYAGKASSIFYLMYRLLPQFRQLYGYNEVQRFVEHHGLQETITTVKSSDRTSSAYGYSRENVRVRELPGVSPGMVTMLLPNTAFIKLADMELNLPEYREERLPIPLDERLSDGLGDIACLYDDAAKLAREGHPGLLSAWLYASLGWLDCPVAEVLTATDREGHPLGSYPISGALAQHDELLDEPLAKDQALIDLIEAELAQERGVGVYFAQVNRRDWMGRIQQLLAQRGIHSEILRQSTCKPEDRESWYQAFVQRSRAKGQEPVLLANGNLVKEGLDLVELPTLIETGIEYRINDLRQRDRRSWRLIQDRQVRVIFLYYENSWQETALQLVAAKLKAALMVEGDLAEGLAAMDVDDGNLMDALMQAVSQGSSHRIEWSGMEIAAIERPSPIRQPALLPEIPERVEVEIDIVQVDVGGGVTQLSWGDLEPMQAPTPPRPRRRSKQPTPKLNITKVNVDGGEQYTFW